MTEKDYEELLELSLYNTLKDIKKEEKIKENLKNNKNHINYIINSL